MKTQLVVGVVHSVKIWSWLAQTVAVGLVGGALGGCGVASEEDEPWLEEEGDGADLGEAALAITGGSLSSGYRSSVKLRSTAGGTSCTAARLEGTNSFLTAGHCIENRIATSVTIFPDPEGIDARTLAIPAGGIKIHPSFIMKTIGTTFPNALDTYDVAVITTTTPIDAFVGPGLRLPANELPPSLPLTGAGIGYGCDANDSTHNGKRQRGLFDLSTGVQNDHDLLSSGPDVACSGDSGGPLISGADGTLIGVLDAGPTGTTSFWSRTASIRNWIRTPVLGNDSSLFTRSDALFFMHNKTNGSVPRGLCMVANSNVMNTPGPVSVQLDACSDPLGRLTGKGSGWATISFAPAGHFLFLHRATGLCLEPSGLAGSGADLQVATCNFNNPSDFHKWSFVNTASAGTKFSTLRIKNKATNLCISTEGSGTAAGTKVEQASCASNTTNDSVQSWVATR